MNHFRRSRVARKVSRILAALMVTPLLVYYAPSARAQATAPSGGTTSETTRIPAVIVLDFNNLSGYGGTVVGRSAAAVVAQAMQESDRWDVLSTGVVNAAMTSQGLTPPLDIPGMLQLGRAAEADAIVFGQVYGISVAENPKQAKVGLRLEMRDVASGELINGAIESAQSGIRPGYSGDAQVLIDEALRKAASQSIQTMQQNKLPTGTVLNTQVTGAGTREVLLNIGAQDGVTEGMQMIVTRNKVRVSRLRIIRVEPDQSTGIVTESTRGAQPEDSVQAVFFLPSVDQLRSPSGNAEFVDKAPKQKKGNKGFGTALAGILGAALLIFALSNGTKSGRLSGPSGGQPSAEATSINNGAPVLPGGAVKVSWKVPNNVRLQDIIQFQIFRSDVVGGTPTTTGGTAATPGTPVGIAEPGETVFYDNNQARDVTYVTLTIGTAQPGGSTSTLTSVTATGVPGVVAGRTVSYRVTMIYRRIPTQNTGSGGTGGTTGGTTGTTTGGTTGTTTGGTTCGTGNEQFFQTPVTVTGLATPLEVPIANSPQGGSTVTATDVTFDVQSVQGANQYMIELSPDPSFRTNVKQIILPVQPTSSRTGSVSASNVNLANLFPNYHGTLYWHAGARNTIDQPGPDPGRFNNGPGNRRWVYSDFESLVIP